MYSEILKLIKTTAEVQDFLTNIDVLVSDMYKLDIEDARVDLSAILSKVPQQSRREYLLGLREAVSKMRALRLAIAHIPTKKSLEEISSWVKSHVGEDVVLEIEVDPRLIGGAVINFAGRLKDFSLKGKFEAELKNYD